MLNIKKIITFKLLIISLILSIVLYFYPINSTLFKLLFLFSLIFLFINIFIFFSKNKLFLILFCSFILLLIFLVFLPWKEFSKMELNDLYIKNLEKYEWVRYVRWWENAFWIDCSWLWRRALIDAYLHLWLKDFNWYLIRKSILIWWFDSSARALLNNYRDQTIKLFESNSINTINADSLKVWDFAITSDWVHVLYYIWSKKWIEADPNAIKVIIVKTPSDNYWFWVPVNMFKRNY